MAFPFLREARRHLRNTQRGGFWFCPPAHSPPSCKDRGGPVGHWCWEQPLEASCREPTRDEQIPPPEHRVSLHLDFFLCGRINPGPGTNHFSSSAQGGDQEVFLAALGWGPQGCRSSQASSWGSCRVGGNRLPLGITAALSPLGQGQGHLPLEGPFLTQMWLHIEKKLEEKNSFCSQPFSIPLLLERFRYLLVMTSSASSTAAPLQGPTGL